jgi:hypothetical protein
MSGPARNTTPGRERFRRLTAAVLAAKHKEVESGIVISGGIAAWFEDQLGRARSGDQAAAQRLAAILAASLRPSAEPVTPRGAVFAFGRWLDALDRRVARERQHRACAGPVGAA